MFNIVHFVNASSSSFFPAARHVSKPDHRQLEHYTRMFWLRFMYTYANRSLVTFAGVTSIFQ